MSTLTAVLLAVAEDNPGKTNCTIPTVVEEQTFWMLVGLMTHHDVRSMFTRNLPRLSLCLYQLEKLMSQFLPDLHGHFEKHQIEPFMFATEWFMTLFGYALPLSAVIRLWDIFFSGGWSILHGLALTLLARSQEQVLEVEGYNIIMKLRQSTSEIAASLLDTKEQLTSPPASTLGPSSTHTLPSTLEEPSMEASIAASSPSIETSSMPNNPRHLGFESDDEFEHGELEDSYLDKGGSRVPERLLADSQESAGSRDLPVSEKLDEGAWSDLIQEAESFAVTKELLDRLEADFSLIRGRRIERHSNDPGSDDESNRKASLWGLRDIDPNHFGNPSNSDQVGLDLSSAVLPFFSFSRTVSRSEYSSNVSSKSPKHQTRGLAGENPNGLSSEEVKTSLNGVAKEAVDRLLKCTHPKRLKRDWEYMECRDKVHIW